MLIAGTDDGIYSVANVREPGETVVKKLLDAEEVFRVHQFDALEGVYAAAKSGLYYSPNGRDWIELSIPGGQAYAVTASPLGDRLYVGTRPARVFVADYQSDGPPDKQDWEEVSGFGQLREQTDWGIPRHDGMAQVRSLCTHPETPERLVAGIEVGGIYVSDDRGTSWSSRHIDGFDAPHTDDIHHIAMDGSETMVASTGSGLYHSTDVGRTWERLDTDHHQQYFREAFVRDGSVYAGGASGSSISWENATDHALFECHDGQTLERQSSPSPEEVAVGWCAINGNVFAATHRGNLFHRQATGWQIAGKGPTPEDVPVRYHPLTWYEP